MHREKKKSICRGRLVLTGMIEEKALKGGMLAMKPRLGFWIGEAKSESGDATLPLTMDDSTWQSPYIFSPSLFTTTSFP